MVEERAVVADYHRPRSCTRLYHRLGTIDSSSALAAAAFAHLWLDGLWCNLPALSQLALVVSGTAAASPSHDTPASSAHNHCASRLTACASPLAFVCITLMPPGRTDPCAPHLYSKVALLHPHIALIVRGQRSSLGASAILSQVRRPHLTGSRLRRSPPPT